MGQYRYRAKNAQGEAVSGVLTAQNETEAVADLRRQSLIVISLDQKRGGGDETASSRPTAEAKGGGGGFFSLSIGGKKKVKAQSARVKTADMVVFTRQMSTMISAGIPLIEGLEILAEQTSNLGFRAVLDEVTADVRA